MARIEKTLTVHLIDVGQGESVIVDYPDGRFSLMDGGPHVDGRHVLPEVRRRIEHGRVFDFAAITQWDKDHTAGIPRIVEEFSPSRFILPRSAAFVHELHKRGEMDRLAAEVYRCARAIRTEYATAGSPLLLLRPHIEVYALAPGYRVEDEIIDAIEKGNGGVTKFRNRSSMAVWVRAWSRSLLIAGEVDSDQYREMQDYFLNPNSDLSRHRDDYKAAWIKLSHHGADGNNPPEMFKLFASPRRFVASASAGGQYGHPHPLALARVRQAGGIAMCTNLGTGCEHLIQGRGRRRPPDPRKPDSWLPHVRLLGTPASPSPCYGTVSIEVGSGGVVTVSGSSWQDKCPYGGPTRAVAL